MGYQIRSCSNCRHGDVLVTNDPCLPCVDIDERPNWQTKRGRPPGAESKLGSKKTGPKEYEDRTLLRQYITLSFTEKDILKAGGYQKVKEYLEASFYKLIKGL